jgi:hypothetical protein
MKDSKDGKTGKGELWCKKCKHGFIGIIVYGDKVDAPVATTPAWPNHNDALIVFSKGRKELDSIRTAVGWDQSDGQIEGFRRFMSDILKRHGANLVGADARVYGGKSFVGGFGDLDRSEVTQAGWSKFSRKMLDYITCGATSATSAKR